MEALHVMSLLPESVPSTASARRCRMIVQITLLRSGIVDPTAILTDVEPLSLAIDAYRASTSANPAGLK